MIPPRLRALRRAAPLAAVLLAAAYAAGCGGGDGGGGGPPTEPPPPPPPPVVASVRVTSPTASLQVGATAQLDATALDASGAAISGKSFTWSSGNEAVARVSAAGLVSATGAGTVNVSARETGTGITGSVSLQVAAQAVASVTVAPDAVTLLPGGTRQLVATVRDAAGNVLAGRAVTWTSLDESRVFVSPTGMVTGIAPGTMVPVHATVEGVTGSAAVTVIPVPVTRVVVSPPSAQMRVGESTQFIAAAFDAQGNPLTGRALSWATTNQAVVTVNASTGVVTAAGPGMATVIGTVEGRADTAEVTVEVPVADVRVNPSAVALEMGESATLAAVARDALGTVLAGRPVAWSTDNPGVATVDPITGVVRGVSYGTANVTATVEGRVGTAVVTVRPTPVARIAITPLAADVVVGETVDLTVTAYDAGNRVLTGRVVRWATETSAIATLDASTGRVTGVAPGNAVVWAAVEGQVAYANIRVHPAPVARVESAPAERTLEVGETVDLDATAFDAAGNVLTGRPVVWRSNSTFVATVDAQGIVTGRTVGGPVAVIATVEGKADTTWIRVQRAAVAGVRIIPDTTINLPLTYEYQLQANALDARGGLLDRTVTWTSSNPAVATVRSGIGLNQPGDVSAVSTGTTIITATSEGHSSTIQVRVVEQTPASLDVAPQFDTLAVGATLRFTPAVRDPNGKAIASPGVTFQSLSPAVATVDATGTVTGVSAGLATFVARVGTLADTAWAAVVGSGTTTLSAFPTGRFQADVGRSTFVEVPVVLDLSRATANGDLGALQFEVNYDAGVFSATDLTSTLGVGSVQYHIPSPGTIRFSLASASPQGVSGLTVLRFRLFVQPTAPVGTRRALQIRILEPPTSTGFQPYPVMTLPGRIHVVR